MRNEISAIKCPHCGSPMYTNRELECFQCHFCGESCSWDSIGGNHASYMTLYHRPLESVDGLIKLGHITEEIPLSDNPDPNEWIKRCSNFAEDSANTSGILSFNDSEMSERISFPCPVCKARIRGYRSQNVFTCGYCGNKIDSGNILDGDLQKDYSDTVINKNLPSIAIPFKISVNEAKKNLLALAAEHPSDFEGQDTERRINEELKAVYLPYQLIDSSWKIKFDVKAGELSFYQECLNWTWPDFNNMYDFSLLNCLLPWDFGRIESFKPLLLDKDIRIVSPLNVESKTETLYRFIQRKIQFEAKDFWRSDFVRISQIGADIRKHHFYVMLPFFYLDRRKSDRLSDRQLRMAVNGQTGKSASLILHGKSTAYTFVREPDLKLEMTHEASIVSAPTPIRYVKPNHLYKITSFEEALERKPSIFFHKND